MKRLKLILPMLAFVLAIGMSFAFVETNAEKDYYATKFILVEAPNGWATIDVECNPQNDDCTVRFSEDPLTEYTVYDSKNLNDEAEGDGQAVLINGPVPNPD
ncbi:DUF6520 family protein [Tamlana crocina]